MITLSYDLTENVDSIYVENEVLTLRVTYIWTTRRDPEREKKMKNLSIQDVFFPSDNMSFINRNWVYFSF